MKNIQIIQNKWTDAPLNEVIKFSLRVFKETCVFRNTDYFIYKSNKKTIYVTEMSVGIHSLNMRVQIFEGNFDRKKTAIFEKNVKIVCNTDNFYCNKNNLKFWASLFELKDFTEITEIIAKEIIIVNIKYL